MPKILQKTKVLVGCTLYFIVIFLYLGIHTSAAGNTLGQNQDPKPYFIHFSSKFGTKLASTTDLQSIPMAGTMLLEDTKMADVTIYVSNQAELYEALEGATGGETISLASGDYGKLSLITFQTFGVNAVYDIPVTITSTDVTNPAVFSGLDLREVRNLTFTDLHFVSNYSGGNEWSNSFQVLNSSGVSIQNSVFEGQLASGTGDPTKDGYPTGKGLVVQGSSGIQISDNEFSTWHRAIVVGGSSDLSISGNDIHTIRSDGMDLSQVQRVVIEENYIHDFLTSPNSPDHADMIQFWTSGTTSASSDIVIRNNTLDVGAGGTTQSIFMRNELVDMGLAGQEMFYRNILIEENIILNGHAHGITVGETDHLTIRNNTVLDSDPYNSNSIATPKISVAWSSKNVSIEANVSAAINGFSSQETWSIARNVLVQNSDPNARGYYELEFLNSSMSGHVSQFVVDPTGEIAYNMAGASRLLLDISPSEVRPLFDVSNDVDDKKVVVFDASYTFGPSGHLEEDQANFEWDFGDGSSSFGRVAKHVYEKPGFYEVQLTIKTKDGLSSTASSLVGICGSDLLSYDSQTGMFQKEAFGVETSIAGSGNKSVNSDSTHSLDIGISTGATSIASAYLDRFFGSDAFDISMILRSDVVGSIGEVFRSHINMKLSVVSGGDLEFIFWSSREQVSLRTTGVRVNDGFDHAIQLSFNDSTDSLLVYVDGQLRGSASVEGTVRSDYPRSLDFGADWGKGVFDGKILAFDLDVHRFDYPEYAGAIDLRSITMPAFDVPNSIESDIPETSSVQEISETGPNQFESQPIQDTVHPDLDSVAYVLDFARLEEGVAGKLVGDASVIEFEGSSAIDFDGKNDAVRLGQIDEIEGASSISVLIEFARSNLGSEAVTLVKGPSSFKVLLEGDSVVVVLDDVSGSSGSTFVAAKNLGIYDTALHQLDLRIDDISDHIQLYVDGNLALESIGSEFDLSPQSTANQWWHSGWSLGSGDRRIKDFEGVITEFQLDDSAMFLSL